MSDAYQPESFRYRFALGIAALLVIICVAWGVSAFRDFVASASPGSPTDLPPIPEAIPAPVRIEVPDSLLGVSRALRFRTLTGAEALEVPGFVGVLGEAAIRKPGNSSRLNECMNNTRSGSWAASGSAGCPGWE